MLFLQENKNDIFVKIIPKIDMGSNFQNWVFKRSFNQITLFYILLSISFHVFGFRFRVLVLFLSCQWIGRENRIDGGYTIFCI